MEDEKIKILLNRKIFNDLDISLISNKHIEEINKILDVYDNRSIRNRLKNIHDFIKYDVDGDWVERLKIIQNVLKNDVMSDYALEIRYGKNNINIVKSELFKKTSHTLEIYVKRYGEIEGPKKFEEFKIKSKTAWGLKACIEKFGEIEGPKKWDERLSKKVKTQKERKLIKPYRNGRTLSEYQNRYGFEDGYNKWFKRNKDHSYRFSKQYYIDKYGYKNGLVEWKKYKLSMDKTSKNSFIERYGINEGVEKHKEFMIKLADNLKERPNYSKISQELFNSLLKNIEDKENVYFATHNEEHIIFSWYKSLTIISIDFKYKNKIIEFDGNYWHSKEKQIQQDIIRDEFLISEGYEILRVKESDYIHNKESIILKCMKFLKD